MANHQRVQFQAGIQQVPASLATQPYILASGAKVYDPKSEDRVRLGVSHVNFLNSGIFKSIANVEQAQAFFDKLNKQEQSDFLAAADNYDQPKPLGFEPLTGTKPTVDETMTERHVKLLQSRGYHVKNTAEASNFYSSLSPADKKSFLEAAARFDETKPVAEVEEPAITPKEVEEAKVAEVKPTAKEVEAIKAESARAEAAKVEAAKPKTVVPPTKK
jgi:hypothetical protein